MGINKLVRSKGFKQFMSKLYGWGASVVIVGALFKINHYPFASELLIVGLGTEALIFFFSAFEPPHVEPDWSLVYPELGGLYHEGDAGEGKKKLDKKSGTLTQELDKMLEEAKIGPALIESLGKGLHNLSETASKLTNVADASVATQDYVSNVKHASSSANELAQAFRKSSDVINKDAVASEEFLNNVKKASDSVSNLSGKYDQVAQSLGKDVNATDEYVNSLKNAANSVNKLTETYTQSSENLAKSAKAIDFSAIDGASYAEQLQKISRNLEALNGVYEMHLKGTNEQMNKTVEATQSIDKFLNGINDSINNTEKYKEEINTLTKQIAALNKVYGGMLSAMNVTNVAS